ncbi:MAG: MBL fold metallo-hydrolase [Clostridiales bacterium]|nr:MBL fold metallo-hydrolase [Clostridiales bacterium]
MRVTVLVENAALSPQLGAQHGLSFYIETSAGVILFDMGKDDLFLKNAGTLGKSIPSVDFAAVSHGHYDHGGGLAAFLAANDHAPVYIRKSAFEPHLSLRESGEAAAIGLDPALLKSGRFVFTAEREEPADGVTLFSGVTERAYFSSCNATILMEENGSTVLDDFRHEQSLLLRQDGKMVLVAGCAHGGIVNILRRAEQILGRMPDVAIGGFHLHSPSLGGGMSEERIREMGNVLDATGAVFYTGHCTGDGPFALLQETLGDRLRPMHAGTVIDL